MRFAAPAAAALLTLPAIAVLGGDRFRLAPRAGQAVRTRFDQKMHIELVDQEFIVVTGEEESAPSRGPEVRFVIEESEHVVFHDEYVAVAGDVPTELRRTYEEIASRSLHTVSNADGENRVTDGRGTSALQGRKVLFSWDERKRDYRTAFDDGKKGDAALLKDLVCLADQRWFLPEDEVQIGASWDVDPSAFRALSYPGGDLSIVIEGDDRGPEFGERFHERLEGDLRATYAEVRELEGRRLAAIGLVADLETEFDLELEIRSGGAVQRSYAFELDLAGEILWDLAASRPVSLDWAGKMAVETEARRPTEDFELLTRQRFEGTIRFEVEVEID